VKPLVNQNLRKNDIDGGAETKTPVNIAFTGEHEKV
jgi:hypothetical protein